LFRKIRENIGKTILKQRLRNHKRSKNIFNFTNSQKVGVLFKTDSFTDFEYVRKFLQYLTENENKVIALCYVNSKRIPDYYLLKKGFNYFSRNDLTVFFIPDNPVVDDFINMPFDILINLSLFYCLPVHYITSLSKAKFKIGPFIENHDDCYDFMIDIQKDRTIKNLIDNIKHYIPVITGAEVYE